MSFFKKISFVSAALFLLACTDYVQQIDDQIADFEAKQSGTTLSSSSNGVLEYFAGTLTDFRDGQTYKTVKIGSQTWMAENLNFKTDSSFCYNDMGNNCSAYGRLYTWTAATTACPSGWHLPSKAEWEALFNIVDVPTAGIKLKSTSGWSNSGNGADFFGFTALPAGYRSNNGRYFSEGDFARFWSSTENGKGGYSAFYMNLTYGHDDAELYGDDINVGYSVRCLQDDASGQTAQSSSSEKMESSSSNSNLNQFNPDIEYGELLDSRDGLTYKTVKIGSQTWMAQNLNYETDDSYCSDGKEKNCSVYGRLYKWNTAKTVCPAGWHLPSRAEYETLLAEVGGGFTAGTELRALAGWNSNGDGFDSYGFSAIPAGYKSSDGQYVGVGYRAHFWSSTEDRDDYAYYMYVVYNDTAGYVSGNYYVNNLLSVRCLKDDETTAQSSSSVKSSSSTKSSSPNSSSSDGTGLGISPTRVGPVSQYGQLMIGKNSSGKGRIYGSCEGVKDGAEVQVRGMSLYWSLMPQAMEFWTEEGVTTMVNDMKIQVVRAAMATGDENWLGEWNGIQLKGYGSDPTNQIQFVKTVVEAAIKNDIYVIIDWHSHNANEQTESAKAFFKEMAEIYGQYDNVIFEIFNEPKDISWSIIKEYANQVVSVIRQYSDNLILVGTPRWDQNPQLAIGNEVTDNKKNTAYTLHYYANSHCVSGTNDWGEPCEGAKAEQAINAGLSVFVSEWGAAEASNNGSPNYSRNESWQEFINGHKLSWANWSASYASETASAFPEGSSKTSLLYTQSGNLVKGYLASNPETYTACSANP